MSSSEIIADAAAHAILLARVRTRAIPFTIDAAYRPRPVPVPARLGRMSHYSEREERCAEMTRTRRQRAGRERRSDLYAFWRRVTAE